MGSCIAIKDVAATKNDTTETLAYLTWYSISECHVKREELALNLKSAGLDEEWMPPVIRISDAFRKATKAIEKKRVPNAEKTLHNYLVREVSSDKYHIQRNIVLEVVDTKGKRLDYRPEEAIMTLDKKNNYFYSEVSSSANKMIESLLEKANKLFLLFKTHHDSRAIRSMVYNMLASMAPTPVRPSGGVYMVPAKYQEELQKLTIFLRQLPGESEAHMVPLIDTSENRDMMREKIRDYLVSTIKSLKNGLTNPKLDKSNACILLDEAKRRLKDFKEYQKCLHDEMEDMEELTSLIGKQIQTLIDKDF